MKFLLSSNKKIYFASDLHLIIAPNELSRRREQGFIQWLDTIKTDAAAVFLLGDIFDFWFEYRHTVPRGFVRLLGKLAELTDSGISIHFFKGNHDQWVRDYLTSEMNITVHHKPAELEINGKLFLIGHGHDVSLKTLHDHFLHFMFDNRFFRMLFASLNPRWGIPFGKNWSINHRNRNKLVKPFTELDEELIYKYAKKTLLKKHYDFFVFGHRHLAMDIALSENSRYINTGEWVEAQSYAVFDGENIELYSAKGKMEFMRISEP